MMPPRIFPTAIIKAAVGLLHAFQRRQQVGSGGGKVAHRQGYNHSQRVCPLVFSHKKPGLPFAIPFTATHDSGVRVARSAILSYSDIVVPPTQVCAPACIPSGGGIFICNCSRDSGSVPPLPVRYRAAKRVSATGLSINQLCCSLRGAGLGARHRPALQPNLTTADYAASIQSVCVSSPVGAMVVCMASTKASNPMPAA